MRQSLLLIAASAVSLGMMTAQAAENNQATQNTQMATPGKISKSDSAKPKRSATSKEMLKLLLTEKAQLSYAMGYETGKAFKQNDIDIDPKVFALAVADGMSGFKPRVSAPKMQIAIKNFRKNSLKRFRDKMKKQATKNAQMGAAFLAANKKKAGVFATPSGLQYKVLTKGDGPKPQENATVTVNYEGRLINGKIFDSSYQRGKPATFNLQGVIKGWREGLTMMRQGATWELYIPAKLAYGEQAPPSIGPNQVLIFKVNLIKIKPAED